MSCVSCTILTCGTRYLMELMESVMKSPVGLAILSLFIAIIIMVNVHSAHMFCGRGRFESGNARECQCNLSVDRTKPAQEIRQRCSATNTENFDYSIVHGPHTWQHASNNQSPINIDQQYVKDQVIMHPLMWFHYNELPMGIMLENNGKTLVLRAAYGDNTPMLVGADLLSCYSFVELCFRWSWSDTQGSEHTLNYRHFPLELQAMHRVNGERKSSRTSSFDVLMVSYFYELATENPYMDALLQSLTLVQEAGQRIEIPPFPLSFLMPAFQSHFYSYTGSLTEPPCHSGIEWLVYPEPLAIGANQLNELRQLHNHYGTRIMSNARPVQPLGENRYIYWNILESQDDSTDSSITRSPPASGSSNNYSPQVMNKCSKCCSHANGNGDSSSGHFLQKS